MPEHIGTWLGMGWCEIFAGDAELSSNPRARSAVLRVAERHVIEGGA